jgi:hypothetical protein
MALLAFGCTFAILYILTLTDTCDAERLFSRRDKR